VKGGQLEEAIKIIHDFGASGRDAINRVSTVNPLSTDHLSIAHAVLKTEIAANGDFNLSGERYKIESIQNAAYPIRLLSEIVEINPIKSQIKDLSGEMEVSFVPMADLNEN